ncbi:hypothetical protein Tco_0638479 [Tanacetum coccineum]
MIVMIVIEKRMVPDRALRLWCDGGFKFSKDDSKRVISKEVSLFVGVLDGAFGGVRDEEVVVGEGVVVTSSLQ